MPFVRLVSCHSSSKARINGLNGAETVGKRWIRTENEESFTRLKNSNSVSSLKEEKRKNVVDERKEWQKRIRGHCKAGNAKAARDEWKEFEKRFEETEERKEENNALKHKILTCIGVTGNVNEMYHFIANHIEKPNLETYESLIESMAMYGALFDAANVIKTIQRIRLSPSEKMQRSLVIAAAEMGRLDLMKENYLHYLEKHIPNESLLLSMASAFLLVHQHQEALQIFEEEYKKYNVEMKGDSFLLLSQIYKSLNLIEDCWIYRDKAQASFKLEQQQEQQKEQETLQQ